MTPSMIRRAILGGACLIGATHCGGSASSGENQQEQESVGRDGSGGTGEVAASDGGDVTASGTNGSTMTAGSTVTGGASASSAGATTGRSTSGTNAGATGSSDAVSGGSAVTATAAVTSGVGGGESVTTSSSETGVGGTGTGGTGSGVDCREVACFRGITCVARCGGPVVKVGCCPCDPGTFDDIECSDVDAGAGGSGGGTLGQPCSSVDACAPDEYCSFVAGQFCGAADARATCERRPELCPQNYAPVCGCDGETHSNSCSAAAAGVGVSESGPCEEL